MEDCFSDIYAFGASYKRAKVYSKADSNAPGAPAVNEIESPKEQGPCFKCGELHLQNRCTKDKGHSNYKFQNYKKTNQEFLQVL